MSYKSIGFDNKGIVAFEKEGVMIYNPFEIALQAMIGENVMIAYDRPNGNLIPRYYPIRFLSNPVNNNCAHNAMNWIIANQVDVNGSCVWQYNYDIEYGEEKIQSPWVSSFGQSYIILALLLWYKYTKDDLYKNLVYKAISGLALTIEEGGTAYSMSEGYWYEEIPMKNPTHIFNAHLISLIALSEAYHEFREEMHKLLLESGLRVFSKYANYMDSGQWSVYDIPHNIDIALQLVPADPGRKIMLRSIFVNNRVNPERAINLSTNKCFKIHKQWAAGIDWGKVDTDGYRELLYGSLLHPVAVPTGDRQNSFIYFKSVSTKEDVIALSFEYKVEYDTELHIKIFDGDGEFRKLGVAPKVTLNKGNCIATVYIPTVALTPALSQVYHKYHIALLEELERLIPDFEHSWLLRNFRKYSEIESKNKHKTCIPTKLQNLFVSVNQVCGLACKMCDFGIKNEEASLFKNLHSTSNNSEIDARKLIDRCKENIGSLKTVHFIGTEPTLYSNLPMLVKELKLLGLQVIVTTNGVNLKSMIKDLLVSGLDSLWVSMDGPPHIHDMIRGRKGLFELIYGIISENENIILDSKKNGFTLNISFAITPMNYKYMKEFILSTENLPIDLYWFTHMNYVSEDIAIQNNKCYPKYKIGPSCTHEKMMPSLINPYEMLTSIYDLNKIGDHLNKNIVTVPRLNDYIDYEDYYFRPNVGISKPECEVAKTCLQVNSDGRVCVMARCFSLNIGNICDNTLNELFYSNELIRFRDFISSNKQLDSCKRCCGIME